MDRVVEITNGTVKVVNQHIAAYQLACPLLDVNTLLSKIHYFRLHNSTEQIAITHLLPEFMKQHPNVKIIIVDSIAFHFRHGFQDMALRNRILSGMAQTFMELATRCELAVRQAPSMPRGIKFCLNQGCSIDPAHQSNDDAYRQLKPYEQFIGIGIHIVRKSSCTSTRGILGAYSYKSRDFVLA